METAILIIRLSVAMTMVLFGINQFLKPGDWTDYIPKWIRNIDPLSPVNTMRLHSLGNIIFGLWLAMGIFPGLSVWVNIFWWISILPFAFLKDWRIGLRDLSITASLIALLLIQRNLI
jgi:hypothetical protein